MEVGKPEVSNSQEKWIISVFKKPSLDRDKGSTVRCSALGPKRLNPLTVGHITLAAGDGLQRMRVDQIDLEATLFQNLKQWDPVHPGGLHRYRPDATTLQPLGQGV